MPKERANARVEFRADDVLEPAGLCVRFGFVNGKSVLEQTLGQTMAANHVARALASSWSQLRFPVAQRDQMQLCHTRKQARGGLFRHRRKFSRGPGGTQTRDLSRLPFLTADPNLFEEVIKANFVVG